LESAGRPLLSWGTDNLGRFSVTQVTWRAEGSGRRFQTNVRAYESVPAVALQQVLLDGTDGAAFSDDDLVRIGHLHARIRDAPGDSTSTKKAPHARIVHPTLSTA
jgi:hypothetical protein